MSFNKTNIEWCDITWSPVSGCLHDKTGVCKLPCYARKMAENPFYRKAFPNQFRPTFYQKRLIDPIKERDPRTVFICSMGDIFGSWNPEGWLQDVFDVILLAPQHTYCFLTKNPKRMYEWSDLFGDYKNIWWGTTVTGVDDTDRIGLLQDLESDNLFVSFEPLLETPNNFNLDCIKGIIIGAQTKPLVLPTEEAMKTVETAAKISINSGYKNGTKIFHKNSIVDNFPIKRRYYRQLPWKLYTKGVV